MRSLKAIILVFIVLFIFATFASSHPLGNFSVNNYSRIEVDKNQVRIRSVLDMAEIPTFQESQQIDKDKNGTLSMDELDEYLENATLQYVNGLKLIVDNKPIQIETFSKKISLPMGAGNLPTLRIEWDFTAKIFENETNEIHVLSFENTNYKERVGWNEIVVERMSGVNVFDSTAFGNSVTNELKKYPDDMLAAPLKERTAQFSFNTGSMPENVTTLQNRNGSANKPVEKDRLAALISVPEITPAIALVGLLIAFGLGAVHAMSPGHGKTVVGAYLVGSKGTAKHAAFLGLTVTITHTLGVFALGLITLFASHYILPERLMPFLNFVSGLIVFFIGVTLFKERLLKTLGYKTDDHHEHHYHENENENALVHTHDGHTHSHQPLDSVTWRNLLALGISGGLLPCPSALVLMLSAISLNRVGYGLILTLAFSIGLAATLMFVGLIFLYLGKLLDRPTLTANRFVKALPVFSAFVVAFLGAVICYNSLV